MPAPCGGERNGRDSNRSSGENAPDLSLSRQQRVTRTATFQEAYDQGRNYHGKYMVMWVRSGDDAAMRLGVVTSRRVGPAVARTRARRQLREAYRRHRSKLSGPYDVILVARKAISDATSSDLETELLNLARKARLVAQLHDDRKGG